MGELSCNLDKLLTDMLERGRWRQHAPERRANARGLLPRPLTTYGTYGEAMAAFKSAWMQPSK